MLHLADLIALAVRLIELPAEMLISVPCLGSLPSDLKIFLTFLHFLAGCSSALQCFSLLFSGHASSEGDKGSEVSVWVVKLSLTHLKASVFVVLRRALRWSPPTDFLSSSAILDLLKIM